MSIKVFLTSIASKSFLVRSIRTQSSFSLSLSLPFLLASHTSPLISSIRHQGFFPNPITWAPLLLFKKCNTWGFIPMLFLHISPYFSKEQLQIKSFGASFYRNVVIAEKWRTNKIIITGRYMLKTKSVQESSEDR